MSDYRVWEGEIIEKVGQKLNIPYSDAQAVVEVSRFEMAQEWVKGSSSEEAAERIAKLG